ncbi:MAG: hypothetical protein AMJ94_09140 [Deltaproteobacteria bacterium SM23_61]|nr:MAG: hypothetical protein AMJ94_09140 [Deltaproteobacteria bacterium SM23_61]
MIKDLKQRLGLGDYQVRTLRAIQCHVTLVLLSYFTLILLKILQWIKDERISQDLSIWALALQFRRQILIERITVKLNNLRIQFKKIFLTLTLSNYGLKKCKTSVFKFFPEKPKRFPKSAGLSASPLCAYPPLFLYLKKM